MTSDSYTGLHYRTRQPVTVTIRDGCIHAIQPAATHTTTPPWIAPALVDLQVNGFAGVDFQLASLDATSAAHAAQALLSHGVTRCLPTLITDDWNRLLHRLECACTLAARVPAWGRVAPGWHLEGPWLNPGAGFRGAHDPGPMCDPSPAMLQEALAAAGGSLLRLTLAPERPGSIDCIHRAVECGLRVSLGHTDANREQLQAAVAAGASAFTHLGNGCPQSLDRHDNILWRVLDLSAGSPLMVSLIPDGHHVSPALFRLIHRLLPAGQLFHVSDAMSGAAATPGRHTLGRLELETGTDGLVRLPGSPLFAGSSLTPLEGVFRAASMLGCRWQESWDAFSTVPARWMGWSWGLEPGAPADFCLLDWLPTNDPHQAHSTSGLRLRVIQAGHEVHDGSEHCGNR